VALFGLGLFVLMKTANAASYLGSEWDQFIKGSVPSFQGEGQTGEQMAFGVVQRVIRIVRLLVGAAAVIMGILYGMSMIFARGNEEAIGKQKKNFLWAFIGFVILIISENVANVLNPIKATNEQLIDFNAARDQFRDIANYIKWLLGSVIVLMMTISGFRMITAGHDEELITKQKRNLTWSMIGMLTMLLASNIVNSIYVINSTGEAEAAKTVAVTTEIASVIRLVLMFLGPAAILFTIYAGYMYLTAMDNEEQSKKGKTMIIGGITGIVMIYGAYALVNTILSGKLG